jgi:hypothetical protein
VDCDIAPLSACHLLLGRPWQFDLDATHSGRSNSYSFVHKGIHHVLKPMAESAINAEVFAPVKKKKTNAVEITPKPRTALLQGTENDEICPAPKINDGAPDVPLIIGKANHVVSLPTAMVPKLKSMDDDVVVNPKVIDHDCSSKVTTASTSEDVSIGVTKPVSIVASNIPSNATKEDVMISSPSESSRSYYDKQQGAAMVAHTSSMQFGLEHEKIHEFSIELNESSSNISGKESVAITCIPDPNNFVGSHGNQVETFQFKHVSPGSEHYHKNGRELASKPRTALFQGREDDESMARQNISDGFSLSPYKDSSGYNLKDPYFIKLGAFSFDVKQNLTKAGLINSGTILPSKLIFKGSNYIEQRGGKKPRKYLCIGSMQVEVT